MKKKFLGLLVLVLLLTNLFVLFACKDGNKVDEQEVLQDNKGKAVEGLSAYEVATSAYYLWKNNEIDTYQRVEELVFDAGSTASRKERQVYTQKGNVIDSVKVTANKGLAGDNKATKYSKTSEGKVYWTYADKSKVPGKEDNLYAVTEWPDATEITDETEKEEKYDSIKKMITTYDLTKKEYLTADSDDTVYEFLPNSNYYICTLTIDMSNEAMENQQSVAKGEFEDALDCVKGSLVMNLVNITFVVEKYNDGYRVVKWQSIEDYKGKKAIVMVKCYQTYTASFNYDLTTFAD